MQIYGSKKGQGKQRQPVIAPDSAQSKTYINMLFGLGEGEIAGLANGYKSVYLDDTPLQNDNGEFNFPNVKVDFRNGTTDQAYIDGFPDVASETAVNVELKHGTPFVKAFNNLDLDAVRIRLKWGALRSQNAENGDVSGVKIDYAIDLKTDNGGWVQVLSPSINAKTSDAYERSHRIDLPPATTGWQVRVRRLTPNSTSDLVSDRMFVSAITEVIDLKLRYPNTALLGLRYDATSFSNVAKMSARCKGLIIKVPTNYDPVARTYTGLWSGEFKLAYSNNPAWVYYDLCTNTRYGLGNRLTPAMIDKWSLYRLAQYCDQMVDDGMGGQEPRFTVNIYIQSSEGAFELLSKLAGVFRAISYWDGNSIVLDADIPQDSIYSFSRANVIDGVFEYTGTRARDRHTVAKVAWDNPNNHFKTEYEFVRDEQAIAKFGTNIAEISAWGCTSKGQAQRAGLWALKSEQLETRMVTFKVGLDGYIPSPAKVIEISDELFAGRANGGRVVAINKNKTVITTDRPITAKAGDTLVINGDDGTSQRRQIKSINGDKITVTKAFTNISVENIWVLDSQDLATMKFRVLSVTADENHQFTITAVQYNPAKYDAIDTGAYIDERPISVINPTVQAPTKSVNLSSYHTINQGVSITTLVIGWEQVAGAVKYSVEWRKDNGNWQTLPPTGTNSIEVAGVYAGAYEAKVTAISAFGQASIATHSTLTQIHGKQGKPNKLARLTAIGKLFAMDLNWAFGAKSEDTNFTEIQVSPDGRSNITTLGTFAYPTNKHEITGLQGGLTQFYRGRIVDKLGNASDWTAWVRGVTDNQAEKVLNLISGQINESHLHQNLSTPIAKIGTLESAVGVVNGNLSTLNSQLATAQNELNTAKSTLQTAVGNITTERNRITTAIRDITALQSANNAKTQEIANLTNTVGGHTSSIRELGVTTGDLSQKYTALKTATDTANSEIMAIRQTQNGQATSIERLSARFDNGNLFKASTATNGHFLDENNGGQLTAWASHRASDFISVKTNTVYEIRSFEGNFGNLRVMWYDTDKNFIKGQIIARSGDYATFDSENASFVRISSFWTRTDNNVWQMQVAGLASDVGANLDTLRQTLTDADTALSQQITAMDTAYKSADRTLTANLQSEITARTNADNALGQRIDTLQADYNGNKASVANQLKTLSNKDTATASQISSLTANVSTSQSTANNALTRANTANSAITAEQRARADADSSLASQITALDTAYKSADSQLSGRITTAQQTATNAQNAVATAQSQLNARFDNLSVGGRNLILGSGTAVQNGSYPTKSYPLVSNHGLAHGDEIVITVWGELADTKTAFYAYNSGGLVQIGKLGKVADGVYQLKTTWKLTSGTNTSTNTALNIYPFNRNQAGVSRIDKIKLERGNIATDWTPAPEDTQSQLDEKASTATLDEFKRTQATKDTATAQAVQTLQTTVQGQSASIQQHAQSLNGLSAQWTLKVQSGNIVSGIGLASSNGVSDFAVRADKFYIASPTGQKGDTPFTVLTSPQVIDGVQVPAGTYIRSACIQNGSITNAKLANASIDNAKIANASIDTAKIKNGSVGSMQIADGAITTAKIGALQVDTLQIKDNAVTIPRAITLPAKTNIGLPNNHGKTSSQFKFLELAKMSFSNVNANVPVMMSLVISDIRLVSNANRTANGSLLLLKDGNILRRFDFTTFPAVYNTGLIIDILTDPSSVYTLSVYGVWEHNHSCTLTHGDIYWSAFVAKR